MERTKVKNLAKQIRGVSYKPEDLHDSLDEDSVILLRANNIDEGKINFDDVVYVDKSKVSDEQYLKVGDVLICASSGSKQLVGKAASVDFDSPCTFGAFCKVVRPNNNVADYLGKYFQSGVYRRKISEVAIGANINNIRNEHIDSLVLPIYEPAQTHIIVEKIGLLQNIIDNRKCELSKLDDLIKARFVEMFGDPVHSDKYSTRKLLSCVADKSDMVDGPFGSQVNTKVDYIEDGEIPVIRTVNVKMMSFSPADLKYMTREKYETVKRSQVLPGDVILTKVGTIGNVCIFPDSFEEAVLSTTGSCRIRVDNSIENTVFFAYNLMYLKGKLLEIASAGVQPFLNMNHVKNIDILDVPLDKQIEFSDFVKQVDKSKVAVQKALDEAQLLFDSLMQECFG